MKTVSAIFFKGLAAILPPTITIYFFYWLGSGASRAMEPLFKWLFEHLGLGEVPYRPWMGVGLAVAIVFVVGLLMNAYIVRTVYRFAEAILERIPLVKTLYGSVRDLMGFFSSSDKEGNAMSQVVMVRIGDTPARLVGLVTRDDFSDLPAGMAAEDSVAVYLPMSYQLGGFTAMVPRANVEPIDMTVEEAMRFAVTAGMGAKE